MTASPEKQEVELSRSILIGHVDRVIDGAVTGWALKRDQSTNVVESSVTLLVAIDGHVAGTMVANALRDDVKAAEGGDGLCGFQFRLPASLQDGGIYTISFIDMATRAHLTNSPFTYSSITQTPSFVYVSCHKDICNNHPPLREPQSFLNCLRDKSTSVSFSVDKGEVFPEFSYQRPLPPNDPQGGGKFLKDLHLTFLDTNHQYTAGPSSRLVLLSDVYIYNSQIHHIEGNSVITVYETARPPDRPFTPQPNWTPSLLRESALHHSETLPLLFLGSAGYLNYGHWLVDDLPRAAAVTSVASDASSDPIKVVTHGTYAGLNTVKEQTLRLVCHTGLSPDVMFIPFDRPVYFKSIYYVTPVTYHPVLKSPEACRFVRESVMPSAAGRYGDRIFVARRPERGRGIENQSEVESILQRYGFMTIDVEGMTFQDQVDAFSGASVIAGCMGAAMTNSVFSKPGTQLLYFAPEGWIEPFYWDLAAVNEHLYLALHGTADGASPEPHRNGFAIDTEELNRILLDQMLLLPDDHPRR